MPTRNRLLQRKCACGGTPGLSGECEECRKKRLSSPGMPAAVQNKLMVNRPGDDFEKEADRVAEAVVSGKSVAVRKSNPAARVQRQGVDEKRPPQPAQSPVEDQKPREQPTQFPAQELPKHDEEKKEDDIKKLGRGGLKVATELTKILWDQFSNSEEGKRILAANERDLKPILKFFEDFVGTLFGKVALGAAAGGAVAGAAGGAWSSRDQPSGDPDTSPSTGGPVRRAPKDENFFGLELNWDFVSPPTGVTLKTPWLDAPKIPLGAKPPTATPTLPPPPVIFKTVPKIPRICTPADPQGDQGEADARSAFIYWWLKQNQDIAKKRQQELLEKSQLRAPPKFAPSVLQPMFKVEAGAEAGHDPQAIESGLRSPGKPLDQSTRAFMEPRFGHDFSQVRIHTDIHAAESAGALKALAYTVGRDLVFAPEQYQPYTACGQKLLAHELAHVVQQGSGALRGDILSS
ncbi:MAG TPA: DUF4157 domain-containing protein, partial [Verrucomicrobiaceae bacterium]